MCRLSILTGHTAMIGRGLIGGKDSIEETTTIFRKAVSGKEF